MPVIPKSTRICGFVFLFNFKVYVALFKLSRALVASGPELGPKNASCDFGFNLHFPPSAP